MLEDFFNNARFEDLSAIQISSSLLMALILGIVTSFVYRKTHSGYSYSRSFNVTLIAVTMTIAMIMMIIGNYWVLSLGLVGALSVIRFRTAIKDPRDIAYLFLAIAIGLACSTGNYLISILGAALINGTLYALHWTGFGGRTNAAYILTAQIAEGPGGTGALEEAIRAKDGSVQLRSYARIDDAIGEYVYTLEIGNIAPQQLIEHLNATVPGLQHLSLIAPESNLDL